MTRLLIAYVLTALVFFAIDLVWLGLVARDLYQRFLGHLLGDVQWGAAVVFYLLFIVGIFIFAIVPAVERGSPTHALLMGGLFGFFTYATYDLTNLATLEGWPLGIVFIDIAWGVVLTGVVAFAGYQIMSALG
ncbi:MAG: DUF2177 family protein [Longimicrobiales bacterium]|nr:DUF2177 family protein [Longimicrobiales bacterium]